MVVHAWALVARRMIRRPRMLRTVQSNIGRIGSVGAMDMMSAGNAETTAKSGQQYQQYGKSANPQSHSINENRICSLSQDASAPGSTRIPSQAYAI